MYEHLHVMSPGNALLWHRTRPEKLEAAQDSSVHGQEGGPWLLAIPALFLAAGRSRREETR